MKKNKTGKKEKLATWERATSKTMALFEALIFKTMIDMQRQIHGSFFYRNSHSSVISF